MEITINLPKRVLANLSAAAKESHRRVDDVIVERLEQELEKQVETLSKQVSVCSDQEVLSLAKLQMPDKRQQRMSELLQKQSGTILSAREQQQLWELIDESRLETLKKAFALREITRRGLHEQN